jgi:hypothetical protein
MKVEHGLAVALNVQGSRYGGQFAINLGIHPVIIPDVRGNPVGSKGIPELLCEFRRRLSSNEYDQWWKHDESAQSIEAAVREATAVYESSGRTLLSTLVSQESPIFTMTPDQFLGERWRLCGFGSTVVRMALVFARIRKAQEEKQMSRRFAEIGLANLGAGVGLGKELRELASAE